MNRTGHRDFRLGGRLLMAAGLAIFAGGALAGCKNSTSAAMMEHEVGPPPVATVQWTGADVLHADPLQSPAWRDATWLSLIAPANTTRTTAPCRTALLLDARNLYVAFVSEGSPEISGDTPHVAGGAAGPAADSVSLFLDSSQAGDGREMVQITADPTGAASCTWFRSANAIKANADGSPDLSHPIYSIPNWKLGGLACVAASGMQDGKAVWTAVLAIPLEKLPPPLTVQPEPGETWKFNLLRTQVTGGEELQANFSPVYVGQQPVSPNRMAKLEIGNP